MITAETLWLSTVNYVRNVLDPDVDMKTLNEVAVKVYEKMKFLVADSAQETRPVFTNEMVQAIESDADELGKRMVMGKEMISAQHEETGRMWEGPRDQIPPGYSEVNRRA